MKKHLLFFLLGCALTALAFRVHVPSVHAQVSSPSYGCETGAGGASYSGDCTQYIVAISSARLGGGVWVYQVQSNPVDIASLDEVLTQTNYGSAQYFKPSSSSTFTLAVTQP